MAPTTTLLRSSTPYHYTNKPLPLPLPTSVFLLGFSIPCSRHHIASPVPASPVSSASPLHPRRQFATLPSNSARCSAAKSGPPLPPEDSDSASLTGLVASFSKFQDKVQIFFAVLFWMSLFFWASVWDERSRPNKGSRFRK